MKRSPIQSVGLLLCSVAIASAQTKPPANIYLRYKASNLDGAYAKISMSVHREPWSLDFPTLPRSAEAYPRLRMKRNNYSSWAELVPDWGAVVLSFFAPKPAVETEVEIQLADRAEEAAVFKTVRVKELGNIVSLCLPEDYRQKPEGIITVRQASENHLHCARQTAADLRLSAAEKPLRFSFFTGGGSGFRNCYCDPAILKNELLTLRTLGINGIGFPADKDCIKLAEELGFDRYVTTPGSEMAAVAAAQKAASAAAFNRIRCTCLMDEPSNYGLELMEKEPLAKFHMFLESNGLKPADFHAASWSEITPVATPEKSREIAYNWGANKAEAAMMSYYWTLRYSEAITNQYYKDGTAKAEGVYPPGVRTFVNYSDHPLILGGKMLPGSPDWFSMGLTRTTTLMWTEDWMAPFIGAWGNGLYQRVGFLVDILRAAASRHHQPIGFYNVMGTELDLRLRAFTAIGHGVKSIYFFDYGPTYAATQNFWSDNPSQYRGVAKIIGDVAKADELVCDGQPPNAQVAVIYSTTEEIWQANADTMPIQQERQLIHIGLAQDQYPTDLLNEDLLLTRDLAQYKAIYAVDAHLPLACLKKLSDWVSAGGMLCLAPASLERDEYDRPTAAISGLTGFQAVCKLSKTHDLLNPSDVLRKARITAISRAALPRDIAVSILLRDPILSQVKAEVLAKFADGSPAILLNRCGQGKVLSYAFMPGLNYFHQIVAANPEGYVVNYPAGGRALISFPCRLAGVQKPLELSQPGVEAHLLSSEKGAAVVLTNFTRQDVAKLTLKANLTGVNSVSSVEKGDLPFRAQNGQVILSLPLQLTDIVLLHTGAEKP